MPRQYTPRIERACDQCGTVRSVPPSRLVGRARYFCSRACRNVSYIGPKPSSARISRTCERCSTDFTAWPHAIQAGNGRFCSRRCARAAGQSPWFPNLQASDPPLSGVYAIVHVPSERAYVGATRNIRQRWIAHRYELARGISEQRLLQETWSAEGAESFDWRILELVEVTSLLQKEREWIARLGSLLTGLNLQDAGSGYGPRKRVGVQPMTPAQLQALKLGRRPK